MPARRQTVLVWALFLPLALTARGEDWEVRRLRTSDAGKVGGKPAWEVVQEAGAEGRTTVRVHEEGGAARGCVLVGRRLRIEADRAPALNFAYTTYCALDHRSGNVGLAIFDPAVWDALGRDAETVLLDGDRALRPLWSYDLHRMDAPDVLEPKPLPEKVRQLMRQAARSYAGREVVLAVRWMAAHTCVEHAAFHDLELELAEPEDAVQTLLDRLDLNAPELAEVKACVGRGDNVAAVAALVAHFRRRWPEPPRPTGIARGSLAECQEALANRFRSIGSDRFYELGKEFTWAQNAIDDQEWLLHFQWHHWLKALVEAGIVEQDPRYTSKAIELIRDWIPQNYPGARWSWRTLEVSIRAMVWSEVYQYLLHAPDFTPADQVAFLDILAEHLDYLLPEERFHSGHNFGATESKALLTVGLRFPEFANAKTWRETAWRRFEGEMEVQVLADGAQNELTTGYHNGVLNTFLAAAQMVEGTGMEPSSEYWRKLERMHDYTLFLTQPDGYQPDLGDSWRGKQGKILVRGGELFNRPDMLYVGSDGQRGEPPSYLDTQLPETGYFVMRTAWTDDPDGLYLCFDAARHWGGWHQHYDSLGIILYAHGRSLMPDAGPFAYGNPLRDHFQGTAFHSTVTVDESNQNTSPCRVHAVHSLPALSFADAEHAGYEGVLHRRQLLFVRPGDHGSGYFLVVDRLTGTGERVLDAHFHLAPGAAVAGEREVRTDFPDGGNLLVRGLGDGELELGTSWFMTGYGKKTDRPDVRFRYRGELPAVFVTLLVPYRDREMPELRTRLLEAAADGMVAVEVRHGDRRDVLFAAPDFRSWSGAGLAVRALAGLLRQDAAGAMTAQALVGQP